MTIPMSVRARLRNPPNAVPDTGITMRNGWPVNGKVISVGFRPRDIAKPIPEVERPKYLCAEFWLPWDTFLEEAPRFNPFSTADIIKAGADVFGISVADTKSAHRTKPLVRYRQAIIAIVCRLTTKSLPDIGRRFGDRDHTTILHSKQKMKPHIDAVAAELRTDATPTEWALAMRARLG